MGMVLMKVKIYFNWMRWFAKYSIRHAVNRNKKT